MPSINSNPRRLPSPSEARALSLQMRERAENHPDATQDDWLIRNLLLAYSRGEVQPRPKKK